jgi:hypothetical protein
MGVHAVGTRHLKITFGRKCAIAAIAQRIITINYTVEIPHRSMYVCGGSDLMVLRTSYKTWEDDPKEQHSHALETLEITNPVIAHGIHVNNSVRKQTRKD